MNSREAKIQVSGLPVVFRQVVAVGDTWLFRTWGDSLGLLPKQSWKVQARRHLGGLWGLQLGGDLLLDFLQHLLVLWVVFLHAGEDAVELGQPGAQALTLHQLGLAVAVQKHVFPVNGGLQVLGTALQGHDLQKVLGGKETLCLPSEVRRTLVPNPSWRGCPSGEVVLRVPGLMGRGLAPTRWEACSSIKRWSLSGLVLDAFLRPRGTQPHTKVSPPRNPSGATSGLHADSDTGIQVCHASEVYS